MATRRLISCANALAMTVCAGAASTALAQWGSYDIRRTGLTDAEHGTVTQQSSTLGLNTPGSAVGYSRRYAKGSGESAWYWSHETGSVRINPTDAAHQSFKGEILGDPVGVNSSGRVAGASRVYDPQLNDANRFGADAWTWTPDEGLVSIGYVNPSDAHPAIERWIQPMPFSQTSDFFSPINAAGSIIGTTALGLRDLSYSIDAWVWSKELGSVPLGFIDADHIQSDGTHRSEPQAINDAGMILGSSQRKSASPFGVGQTAWICTNGNGYRRLGYADAAHTGPNGFQQSAAGAMTSDGRVIGYSRHFLGAADGGYDAWMWSQEAGLSPVGPSDAAHTRDDGYRFIGAALITDSGWISGSATRYDGSKTASEAWLQAPGESPIVVGLYDTDHTDPNGYQQSRGIALNAIGQVAGTSLRFAPGTTFSIGQSGWLFDPASNTTTPLVFSVGSNGTANTRISFLTDDGVVGGNFDEYAGTTFVATHAFLWSRTNGFTTLNALVDGGLSTHGWENLRLLAPSHSLGTLAGDGTMPNHTTASFVLVPHRCLADLNRDSDVTLEDFMEFFDVWNTTSPLADVDDVPGVDLGDFFAFLNHWDAGC